MEDILNVKDLNVYYGVIHAIKNVSFHVGKGEIVTLIGANGAGKTTTLQTITGLVQAKSGEVDYEGQNITKVPGYKLVSMGMAHVPEGRRVFADLTVYQNLMLGAYTRKDKDGVEADLQAVYERFPRLLERKEQRTGTLSGGEQQMLAVGRAMMSKPKLLLLDEPSMGLAPNLVEMIFELVLTIHKRGTTILLIEQNANMALQIADRGYVLETGNIKLSDTAEALRANDDVRKAYLGSAG